MTTYHLSIPGDTITLAAGTSRALALHLMKHVPDCTLVFTVDSAAELERQLDLGAAWAKRLWHTFDVPKTKALAKALKRWRQLIDGTTSSVGMASWK